MLKNINILKLNKILIFCLILGTIFINSSYAWIGLVAETGDILNTTKWNEMISEFNQKIAKINIEEGDNITLTDSGANLVISSTGNGVGETPVITMTGTLDFSTNSTNTIQIEGSNFLPNSVVTIPGFPGSIDTTNATAENNINLTLTSSSAIGIYDIVISNSGALNTQWNGNGVGLLEVTLGIVGTDVLGRKYSDGTYAESCKDYKNPTAPYNYSGHTGDGFYQLKQGANPSFKAYCDMTTDGGGWTRFTDYTYAPGSYYVEDLGDITNNFTELFYSYKRGTVDKFAFKFTKLLTKQCGVVHGHTTDITLALRDYVSHTQDGNWGSCPRTSTGGDSNDIITEKIIEGDFVDDVCLNGTLHKTTARNYSWSTITDNYGHSVGEMSHRVSNSTVLFSSRGKGSTRCSGANTSAQRATKIYMFLR